MRLRSVIGVAVCVSLCLGVAWAGSAVTDASLNTWYPRLLKPPATPPSWVFPVVWTTLFVLMGIALWRVWSRAGWERGRAALLLFGVQLALNFTWSLLFFGLQRPDLALLEIVLLWAAILATIVLFGRHSRSAAALLAPYLVWVTFAIYLNFEIWRRNA